MSHHVGALVAALPPVAEVEYRRLLCREAAGAERERARSAGYVAAVEDMKCTQHEIRDAVRLLARRAAPVGRRGWMRWSATEAPNTAGAGTVPDPRPGPPSSSGLGKARRHDRP